MGPPVVYSESASPETEPNEQILADLIDDEDGESISGDMSTVSITSSILAYRNRYGRTYENIQSTEYWAPNDAQQNHGLDLTHFGLFFTLDEKLFLAPIEAPKRVLDIGTGTGIWAIDFGDEYPEAEVTGTDLSPIQPVVVPPNVKFVIEDCLLDWTWPENHFDFIHIRAMYGSVPDWVDLYSKAYTHLAPGGWIQDLEMDVKLQSDHVKLPPDHVFNTWADTFYTAGEKMGRSFAVCKGHTMRDNLRAAGFVDIVEKKIKAPMHLWPSDQRLKRAGELFLEALEQSIEGYATLLLMDLLGWYREEVQVLLGLFRKEMKDKSIEGYATLLLMYLLGWYREEVQVLLGLFRMEMKDKSKCAWVETTVVYGRKPFSDETTTN